jgi:hypothetical protein
MPKIAVLCFVLFCFVLFGGGGGGVEYEERKNK